MKFIEIVLKLDMMRNWWLRIGETSRGRLEKGEEGAEQHLRGAGLWDDRLARF